MIKPQDARSKTGSKTGLNSGPKTGSKTGSNTYRSKTGPKTIQFKPLTDCSKIVDTKRTFPYYLRLCEEKGLPVIVLISGKKESHNYGSTSGSPSGSSFDETVYMVDNDSLTDPDMLCDTENSLVWENIPNRTVDKLIFGEGVYLKSMMRYLIPKLKRGGKMIYTPENPHFWPNVEVHTSLNFDGIRVDDTGRSATIVYGMWDYDKVLHKYRNMYSDIAPIAERLALTNAISYYRFEKFPVSVSLEKIQRGHDDYYLPYFVLTKLV